MSKTKGSFGAWVRGLVWLFVLVAIGYSIARNIGVFGNILRVLLGFGAVILVHEFGHFIVGKLSGIKVEAFSIFMPPILIGFKRTEGGLRFRILPELFPKEGDESGDGLLSFTIPRKGRASDTEYRVGLIPFGGFVKMLGQDDIGPVKKCDDPRSFANRPVLLRMAVITAGVVFNAISAIIIFMIVFLAGIELPPPVIGGLTPDSPAEKAGLVAGDEVIEIAGQSKGLDFTNIGLAAALSAEDQAVAIKVRHEDGSVQDFYIEPEPQATAMGKLRLFGVLQPQTLTIAQVSDPNKLREAAGFLPGDRITAVNGAEVRTNWEMFEMVSRILEPSATLSAQRTAGPEKGSVISSDIPLAWLFAHSTTVESEAQLYHVYSMVPRLCITYVSENGRKAGGASFFGKVRAWLGLAPEKPAAETSNEATLRVGDIILGIADVNNPTYSQMREATEQYKGRDLPVTVLRKEPGGVETIVTVNVKPRYDAVQEKVLIGIGVALDADHAVVANTISSPTGPPKLDIPSGSVITAVDGVPVSSFYDVVRQITRNAGQRISIDYRLNEQVAGDVAIDAKADNEFITVESLPAVAIPFEYLTRIYKANGPVDAIVMGYSRTIGFITQTYVTFKRLIGGLVSPKSLMGPVGIITLSYQIAKEEPLIRYLNFLGLISAVIAVFNFLPLPPLDGGLVMLLLIEKIKGAALSERAQGAIIYVGWALIGTLVLYVTFNDIVRSFFG